MVKEKNKFMAIICYFGLLILIPMLTNAKNDSFVKFHIKQGLILLISGAIIGVVGVIPILGWLIGFVGGVILFILFITGLINALSGKEEKLPIIGKYGDSINI